MATRFSRAGSGPPLLLLHGFSLSHHVWHGVVDELSADHDVVALTMPGHWGGSRLRLRDVGVRGIADGIERELDELGWDTCHVVGNSLGGQIGFELERRWRARSLVAINPSGGWRRFSRAEFRVGVGFASQFPLAASARLLGNRAYESERFQRPVIRNCSHDLGAVRAADAADVLRAVSHCSIYLTMLLAGLRDGPLVGLGEVSAPTTLVLSEHDVFLTQHDCIQRMIDELPGHVDVVELPGVGHIPMLEDPARVAATIRGHLAAAA